MSVTISGDTGVSKVQDGVIVQADLASGVAGNGPAFSAYKSGGNQTITSSTFTKVQLNTEEFDTNNSFDPTTNYRFTPTVAGYYQINGAVNGESSTGTLTRCLASIFKNGVELKRGSDTLISAGGAYLSVVTSIVYLNGTTDYLELYAFITAGTTAVVAGNLALTYFSGALVRAA